MWGQVHTALDFCNIYIEKTVYWKAQAFTATWWQHTEVTGIKSSVRNQGGLFILGGRSYSKIFAPACLYTIIYMDG